MRLRAFALFCFALSVWAGTEKCCLAEASDALDDETQVECTSGSECNAGHACGPDRRCVGGQDTVGEPRGADADDDKTSHRQILQTTPVAVEPQHASRPDAFSSSPETAETTVANSPDTTAQAVPMKVVNTTVPADAGVFQAASKDLWPVFSGDFPIL